MSVLRSLVKGASLMVATALLALLALAPSASAAFGDGFSFAEQTDPDSGTSAPAFPGTRAFWAGVCDLDAADFAVGDDPGLPFGNCIDHPAAGPAFGTELQPPLSPGLLPDPELQDGWRRSTGEVGGPAWRLGDVEQAGGHPDGTAAFWFSRGLRGSGGGLPLPGYAVAFPDGAPRSVRVSLPAGVLANPLAVPQCPSEALVNAPASCPPKSQVGVSTISLDSTVASYPVYNVEPRDGKTAELSISGVGIATSYTVNQPVVAEVRTDGDFGADGFAEEISMSAPVIGQTITLWGVPWARSHDRYRPVADYCNGGASAGSDSFGGNSRGTPGMPVFGLAGGRQGGCSQDGVSYDPSWGPIEPFFATQTECSPENPITRIRATNWHTSKVADGDSPAPLVTGCEDLTFPASFLMQSTTSETDAASGLDVDLAISQNNDPPASVRFNPDDASGAPAYWKSPAGRAVSHLRDSVVRLPEGFSVNPSAATGLAGCADSQIGLVDGSASPPRFSDGDPFDRAGAVECPQESVIGTARVRTPLLAEELSGEVVLGTPRSTDPMSGEMLRMFIVVRNRQRGLVAKVYGTATVDPATGRIVATFKNNPQVPFDELELAFKDGPHGMLATPRVCGTQNDWTSSLSPWSGNQSVDQTGQFPVDQGCTDAFAPALNAGMDTKAARSNGTFGFKFGRQPGEQYLRGLTATLPKGLLASVKDVPLCTDAQAAFEEARTGSQIAAPGGCPASSKIGIVDAKAGAGDPFVLEKKGEVFLTEGYKGGAYGLLVKVRAIAGPFRGSGELDPIVVRQAIHVDRTTAQVTAVSDPFPLIHHGVPLRVREVTVLINRDKFMLNPSDCDPKQVGADIQSDHGTASNRSNPFQASGCATLAFKPKLTLALTGRKQTKTGKHPGIKAVVTQQGIPEAGIEKAVVRLPKSLALDVNNAQALCEYVDGTKPDLENHCPKGSIVGRARAVSPLLNDPLVGNVYFVKNIRIDPKTGNQIRTLPMIVVALRGEIAVNLKGESDTQNGKLVNTFANVPDAPISQFNLNINGGSKGIIAVTRTRRSLINLCATGRQTAEADMDGQNGRQHDFDINMRKPCTKAQTKAAKRKAKRAAAKARSGSKRR